MQTTSQLMQHPSMYGQQTLIYNYSLNQVKQHHTQLRQTCTAKLAEYNNRLRLQVNNTTSHTIYKKCWLLFTLNRCIQFKAARLLYFD